MAHIRQSRPWLAGKSPQNLSRCSLFARKRIESTLIEARILLVPARAQARRLARGANMAHVRQSRPDSGLGLQTKVFKTFKSPQKLFKSPQQLFLLRSGAGGSKPVGPSASSAPTSRTSSSQVPNAPHSRVRNRPHSRVRNRPHSRTRERSLEGTRERSLVPSTVPNVPRWSAPSQMVQNEPRNAPSRVRNGSWRAPSPRVEV